MDDVLPAEESELGYLYDVKDRVEKLVENERSVHKALEGRFNGEPDVKRREVYRKLLSDGKRHLEQLQRVSELLTAVASDEEEHISLLRDFEYDGE